MSHSDSEIRDDARMKPRKHLKINFKAKYRHPLSRERFRKLKDLLAPILELKLIHAVNVNNFETVKTLLEQGVSPNSADSEKRSALHVAVSRGYADIVEILLKYGADPNKRDIIQNTPLHLAACVHNLAIVTMLINANADVSCLDLHGRNPFQLASSKLQILQRGWKDGIIEMDKLIKELKDVVDLLMSMLMRDMTKQMERINHSDVDDLQMIKLSLNSDSLEDIDEQMSRLLTGIEKFKLT
ncbi:ankyrin repeat domain-containing protein 54-like [Diorhabda carinulata]|uniref:ankyrin repeat domain-containing protein 54-like n=1 Tax=Diorhabda sublineata TaxID=1163346 RepID=UPI0024E18E48|nr:ankyrin repeat domain-containing protein 54-like [Diorhabda sublineata]XP_057656501.1 ankyrin repeat domain-containing protein 54-like [Diorhabda carinulata]